MPSSHLIRKQTVSLIPTTRLHISQIHHVHGRRNSAVSRTLHEHLIVSPLLLEYEAMEVLMDLIDLRKFARERLFLGFETRVSGAWRRQYPTDGLAMDVLAACACAREAAGGAHAACASEALVFVL